MVLAGWCASERVPVSAFTHPATACKKGMQVDAAAEFGALWGGAAYHSEDRGNNTHVGLRACSAYARRRRAAF